MEQEAIVLGGGALLPQATDRFTTTLGATYQLAQRLSLTASESVRWSGTNSTQAGIRTEITDDLSFYPERLTAGRGQTLPP
ncbi:MAG: hypothetical protein R3C68_17615 [Myxococcota bacterium]